MSTAAPVFLALVAASWAADPVVIATGQAPHAPRQPQVAVAHDGTVHVVYGIGNSVFHTLSQDAVTFRKPAAACQVSNLPLGRRRGPRIAVTDDAVVITAIGGEQGKGRDGDLFAWRSIDGGKSWCGPVRVNDVVASAREGLHGMAAGPDGSLWCTWLDLREKSQVYAAKSTDGGATWSTNILVYKSPDGHVCECCHPSIVVDQAGVHVMFRNWLDGNRDMYISTSKDGSTFAEAKKLGAGSWKLNACPMDGGMLASSNGMLATVWRRDRQVYLTNAVGMHEQLLGPGEQPWIAGTSRGPVIVWTSRDAAELWLKTPGASEPKRIASQSGFPTVAVRADGHGPAIVSWEGQFNGQSAVFVQAIEIGN